MNDADFLSTYKATLSHIEECAERAIVDDGAELDYESGNDMLTLTFRDSSVAIISRQSATQQLWLAARSGGFHFNYDEAEAEWICTVNGQSLPDMLAEICLEQGGVRIDFSE